VNSGAQVGREAHIRQRCVIIEQVLLNNKMIESDEDMSKGPQGLRHTDPIGPFGKSLLVGLHINPSQLPSLPNPLIRIFIGKGFFGGWISGIFFFFNF
jgi:hypothetical protein